MLQSKLPIKFKKASLEDKSHIFKWLEEPHVKEFWDNSQGHRDDILVFLHGRKEPSLYFNGAFDYWIGDVNEDPYCLVMTSEVLATQTDLLEVWRENLSKAGKTISIDFMIGNKKYFGKGLGAPTLEAFTQYYQEKIDPLADTFFIDPEEANRRAKHVYEKAGFQAVAEFKSTFNQREGVNNFLMVKKLTTLSLEPILHAG